jgi:ribA/ribD-fused uncharacterized protein
MSLIETHGLDTDTQIFFYEQDYYIFSNFSAFSLMWKGIRFPTSEAAYHSEKFPHRPELQSAIVTAISAHEAFKIAERNKAVCRLDWNSIKVNIMREILLEKVSQHEYVRRKLLATGDRELIENSWRDDFWGWGPNRDGKNQLGKLWMEIRSELSKHDVILNHNLSSSKVPLLISRIARICVHEMMSTGYDVNDIFKCQVEEFSLDLHEQDQLRQLLCNMGWSI